LTPAAFATFEQVARAVRAASLVAAEDRNDALLASLGLLGPRGLTDAGRGFDDVYWIYNNEQTARMIWHDALLGLPETQALMQGLHGRGPVRMAGAHHFMARHGFVGAGDMTAVRGLAQTLNAAGIAAYSNKHQTIRILAPLPEERASVVRVVEPERPYSNVLALREILRACDAYIHWAEPHLPAKALEPLSYEADGSKITEIRLLSGARSMTDATRRDFRRFAVEMRHRGITAEWRIIEPARMDWHDRFILGRRQAWNVPPVNTLFKGDYSEASRTPTRPPFDRWWKLGDTLET
jgi:hypothetical protein